MTEPNPEAKDLPLPDHVISGDDADAARAQYVNRVGGGGPDPVKATAPRNRPEDEEAEEDLNDDEVDESAEEVRPHAAFPLAGPMQGSVVPPGYINPQ